MKVKVKKNQNKEEEAQPRMAEAEAETKKSGSVLPDTVFKILIRREIEQNKLRVGESEIQHISRSDLVIEIPLGVDLTNTVFEFCAPTTVTEFKFENDPFNVEEFVVNQTRTSILFLQALNKAKAARKRRRARTRGKPNLAGKGGAGLAQVNPQTEEELNPLALYNQFLNLYVLARYPQEFLDVAEANGIIFEPDPARGWLRWAKVGFQKVALVICRDLPLEKRFYNWLLFAPSDSRKWEAFVRQLHLEGEIELLDFAKNLRPKEFDMIKMSADELWELVRQEGGLTPEVEAQLARERAEGVKIILSDLDNKDYIQMKLAFDDMSEEQVSQMVNALSLKRLMGLVAYLKPEQIERALPLIKSAKHRQLILEVLDNDSNPPESK